MVHDDKKPLGRILLTRKLVSAETLETALNDRERRVDGTPLASYLIDKGEIREDDALRALSEQFGVPGIDLSQVAIELEHLDVMPRELAEARQMLPVLVRGERLFIAMANPADKHVVDELEFVSGKKVYAYIALSGPLSKTIALAYDAKAQGEQYFLAPNVPKETLARLGLPADAAERASAAAHRAASLNPGAPARAPVAAPPLPDDPPPLVVDEGMERIAANADMVSSEFGNVGLDGGDGDMEIEVLELEDELPDEEPPTGTFHRDAKTVLIVDDEEDIRRMLRRILTDKGYRVMEADRGLLALQMLKDTTPDVIVLDAMLPELHGFDIARRIRGSERYGTIPIIMISAVYRGWRIAEDLKTTYGIEAYIEKPFRIQDVVAAVGRALAKRDTRRSQAPERNPDAMSGDAERALADGVAAYKAGDIVQAIAFLEHGIQIDPLAYRLHFHLALLYGKQGNIYGGIQELERAIELNPKHYPALKNLAVLYEKAGFRHKAVEVWERCVHAAPDAETRAQVKQHLVSLL